MVGAFNFGGSNGEIFMVASGFQCVRLDAIFESGLDAGCEFASSAIGSKGV